MTARKKLARRLVHQQTLTAVDAPPLVLTPAELALVAAYRAMDDRCRKTTMAGALGRARDNPRRLAPALRLVARGAA